LLASEGPAALTLRRLAAVVGTSTTAVYTLFGDKQGLLDAMYREGFDRLAAALEGADASATDPVERLARQGQAYRAAALASPHLYGLMFNAVVPGFVPDERSLAAAESSYVPLVRSVQRCLDAGAMAGPSAERIALHLWTVSHGFVTLEIAGQLGDKATDRDHAYTEAMIYAAVPFLRQRG
jgi:AcrR family transcriptional regulator